jgi:Inner membrane component of T3SS, cytoplasmic domain
MDMHRSARQMEAVQDPWHSFRVRVTHGPDAGREASSTGRELAVGTAPGNQLVLTDPTVSRHHLAVRCTEYGCWVRDLGSTNGVRIDGHRVQVAAMADGCTLAIGDTRVVFELLDDELAERRGAIALATQELPPLCERRDDIPGLVAHFYRQITGGGPPPAALLRAFVRMDWPGNVRELRDAVERAVQLGDPSVGEDTERTDLAAPQPGDPRGPELAMLRTDIDPFSAGPEPAVLTDEFDPKLSFRDAKERAVARWERWYVAQLLNHTHGNLSEAARVARSDRTYLRKLARKHLRRDGERGPGDTWDRS